MSTMEWYIRSKITLRQLQIIITLDTFRSLTKAAAHLHITQPALSKSLSSLENNLGFLLFERTTREMKPTEHGVCLIRHARDILRRFSTVGEELKDISSGSMARISLGMLPASTSILIPRVIADLTSLDKGITISVHEGTIRSLLPNLLVGDVDFVVGTLPIWPLGSEYQTELLYEDPLTVVAGTHHALHKLEHIEWKSLEGYPLVLPSKVASTRDIIDNFLRQNNLPIAIQHLESLSTLTNIGVFNTTNSVGFMSKILAQSLQELGLVKILPLSIPDANLHIGLVWLSDKEKSRVHEIVVDQFRTTSKKLIAEYQLEELNA